MRTLLSIGVSTLLILVTPVLFSAERIQEPALAFSVDNPQLEWGPCPAFLPAGCSIAVLHGDPSQPNVDIFFKVPAGSNVPNHTHTSAERMVLVSGNLEVTYQGQAPIALAPGTYAYGPASKPHKAACADGAPCVLFIAFEDPLDAMPVEAD